MAGSKSILRGIRILHEDRDVIVIEKAPGLLTQETYRRIGGRGMKGGEYCVESALSDWVRKGQLRSSKRVYLVHRLDRETSGVMMVAKSPEVQEYFRANWNELTEKTYLARVEGRLVEKQGVFESLLVEEDDYRVHSTKDPRKGRAARTEWEVLAVAPKTTLVRVTLKSGRKNQIRVHFSEAGYPVLGDARYGHGRPGDRLCLHAARLSFIHPHTRERLAFEASVPEFAR